MNTAIATGARTPGRLVWGGGILCFAIGTLSCAPDVRVDPLGPSAALAETTSSKGWGWWRQTLRIDPDSAAITEPGDTVRLTAILSSRWKRDGESAEIEADWFVLDPEVVAIEGSSGARSTVLLRGLRKGTARVIVVYDGLAAIARVGVEEDDTEDPIPVAAVVSGPQPVLLVGDSVTIRPNLIDQDSVVIPTEPSDWSADFDPTLVSVSEEFLVTALAPTSPGSTTEIVFTHNGTGFAAEVSAVILPDEDPGEWPDNEPAGMTIVLAVDGSSKHWPGFFQYNGWNDDNRVAIVNDPDSKHGQAIEKRFFVGDQSGWHGITEAGNFGAFRELYIRTVFKVSPNWQWHHSGGKYFYYGAAGRARYVGPTQFVLGWEGNGQPFWTAGGHGRHVAEGVPPSSRGVYHTIEIHHVASTDGANGSLRMWVDGVQVQSFTRKNGSPQRNVVLSNQEWGATANMDEKRLSGMQAFLFWGGQSDTKRVNDWIRLSELYISGKR